MKRALALVMTVLFGAGVLWRESLRDDRARRTSTDSPDPAIAVVAPLVAAASGSAASSRSALTAGATERIELLLARAQSGDVPGYLSSFSGALRARLERQVEERGLEAFAAELRRFGELQTSHAVFAAEPAAGHPEFARVVVETVFPDRNERRTYHLERFGREWLITEVERARDEVPKNAVGSWATYNEPEGVPVPLKEEGERTTGEG